jgi:hypothetical protein
MSSSGDDGATDELEPIRLYIPRDVYLVPLTTTCTGLALGFLRGSRQASLRFLVEHAHRPPTTVEEWYFYHKAKNYHVLLSGFKQSAREGLRLGSAGLVWVGFEQGASRVGLRDYREICAGLGLAGTVAAICQYDFSFFVALSSHPEKVTSFVGF